MNIIETYALNYFFSRKQVLDDINLHVPQGSIYGFLGPNGSVKTSTIRALLGLTPLLPKIAKL